VNLFCHQVDLVEPLPHQITAVYEAMLPRQPLRFLLADDPGAGKTIMAGLFIKELIARGDLQRCLVVCRRQEYSQTVAIEILDEIKETAEKVPCEGLARCWRQRAGLKTGTFHREARETR
jgi:Type III restriction enzyme, res subunit